MAYYLTVEKKKGEYLPIDITKADCFVRISNLKGKGASLEEIDIFTMMFNDEMELRQKLLEQKLLEFNDIYKPLAIRRLNKGEYKKVTYGFLYQKDIEYVMDPEIIIKKIHNKLLSKDFLFLSKLANHYLEYHECSSTAPELREYINNSIRGNNPDNHLYIRDENNDDILTRMLKLLIYEYKQAFNGRVTYSDKVVYRNLHSLIAFTDYYDEKHKEEIMDNNNQLSLFMTKKKVKKKQLDGQISLFD